MRQTVTLKGMGASLAQARTFAYSALKEQYKNNVLVYGLLQTNMLVAPKPGKQCTTVNNPPTGARKWETKHVVMGKNPANGELKQLGPDYDSKTEAAKAAKELSLKHQIGCEVHVVKRDNSMGSAGLPAHIEAVISPKMTEGIWEFVLDIETVD